MTTLIILTYNEEKHIARCIQSAREAVSRIIVVDSFSSDNTVSIAKQEGAEVFQNKWPGSQAMQLNWALENIMISTEWILRLDADEVLLPELVVEMKEKLPELDQKVNGIYLKRRVNFLGKWIRHGGYYPTMILRIWRTGKGRFERRWMDEHLILEPGETRTFKNDFVDDNLNDLTWWIEKHNNYSTREAAEILNHKHKFIKEASIGGKLVTNQDHYKRWIKEGLYLRLPLFLRSSMYFFFRYVLRFGFLDGVRGLVWHFLQGFWYRFLVDAKVYQIERRAKESGQTVQEELEKVLGFRIDGK